MKNKLKALGALLVFLGGVCEVEAAKKSSNPIQRAIETDGALASNEDELMSILDNDPFYSGLLEPEKQKIIEWHRNHWQQQLELLKRGNEDFANQQGEKRRRGNVTSANFAAPGVSVNQSGDHRSNNRVIFDSNFSKSSDRSVLKKKDGESLMKTKKQEEVEKCKNRQKLGCSVVFSNIDDMMKASTWFGGCLCVKEPGMKGAVSQDGTVAQREVILNISLSGSFDKFNAICDSIIKSPEENEEILKELSALLKNNPDAQKAYGQPNYVEVVVNIFREIVLRITDNTVKILENNSKKFAGSVDACKKELEAMQKPKGLSLKERMLRQLQQGS